MANVIVKRYPYPVLFSILMGSGGQRSPLGPCNSEEVTLLNRALGLVLAYPFPHIIVFRALSRNRTNRRQRDRQRKRLRFQRTGSQDCDLASSKSDIVGRQSGD